MHFFLLFPLSTTKNLQCCINNKHETLKGEERKTNQWGNFGLKEQHWWIFQVFFLLHFSLSWNWRSWKCQREQQKKNNKGLSEEPRLPPVLGYHESASSVACGVSGNHTGSWNSSPFPAVNEKISWRVYGGGVGYLDSYLHLAIMRQWLLPLPEWLSEKVT